MMAVFKPDSLDLKFTLFPFQHFGKTQGSAYGEYL